MKKICRNGEIIILDKVYLHNNLWGEKSGSGNQCSWIESYTNKNIKWKTSWEWKNSINLIKSFASIVYGWHFPWGWKIKNTKLPIQINDIKRINTSWKYDLLETNDGILTVTYDIWLSNRIIDNENPDGEIMIWLYKKGKVPPIGKKQKEVKIQNSVWELWVGLHPEFQWPVFSFIKKENTTEIKMDIHQFINEIQHYDNNSFTYLLGIQSGIEVLSGKGTLSTTEYLI